MLFFFFGYLIVGILVFARYEKMNPYQRVTYGFLFPCHWLIGIWMTETVKNRSESLWDNEPLLLGLAVIICSLLFLCG